MRAQLRHIADRVLTRLSAYAGSRPLVVFQQIAPMQGSREPIDPRYRQRIAALKESQNGFVLLAGCGRAPLRPAARKG
jgi:hypothetical protein